jgi:hypothetical protein
MAVILAISLTACGPGARPDFDDWQPTWEAALAIIPPPSFADSPDMATCERVVADLRQVLENLLPSPDVALDGPVREWISLAEHAFFECPPREGEIIGFADAYDELDRVRLEVEAVLDTVG